jgi:hypothetical protein
MVLGVYYLQRNREFCVQVLEFGLVSLRLKDEKEIQSQTMNMTPSIKWGIIHQHNCANETDILTRGIILRSLERAGFMFG